MTFANKDNYEGGWSADKYDGYGVFQSGNGLEKYEGNWRDDLRHGQGKKFYSNGDVYEGAWIYGRREGRGVLKFANGKRKYGNWYQNEFVKPEEKDRNILTESDRLIDENMLIETASDFA